MASVPITHRDPGGGVQSLFFYKITKLSERVIVWIFAAFGYAMMLGFLGVVAYAVLEEPIDNLLGIEKNEPSLANNVSESSPPQFSAPALQAPKTGVYRLYSSSARVAPLKITTPSSANYFIRLANQRFGIPVMDIFVRGGRTIEVDVPLGSFNVKYAAGETWYGPKYYFGPTTLYNKTDSVFNFRVHNGYYSGYRLTLRRVQGGNLSSTKISAEDF